ncbi:MAG TPA: glutamate--tRNA ligase [Candidatus Sulfotelmatobacter sp.]|nr:glutamate--tRNA ligase [Candidatus Sulfotelmatobacter sp.]
MVRSRFAPSPTGYIHIGGIRTALFAFLLAKKAQGRFILRIEDTDKARESEGADQHIIDCLNALSLAYDEGPKKRGEFGPYIQSERLDIYKEWANKLIASGRAYPDPRTKEELDALRDQAKASKQAFLIRNFRPQETLDWQPGTLLRFKSDPKDYTWHDEVMGELSFPASSVDDFVLIKSDGFPTYNFAHVVDDHLMQISHVLRGQEFVSSVPNYLNLHEALKIEHPLYATLPHVLNEQGNKKLSKRDGAKDVLEYVKEGYLEEALVSFIATLGWNDGTTQEIYNLDELVDKFSLARIQRSGAMLDMKRLNWINGSLIRQLDENRLMDKIKNYWPAEAKDYPEEYKKRVAKALQQRLKYFAETPDLSLFFFKDQPLNLELIEKDKLLGPIERQTLKDWLSLSKERLSQSDFSENDLSDKLNGLLKETNQKPGVLFSLLRIAVTMVPSSPGLAETMSILGQDVCFKRIDALAAAL